MWLWLAQSWCEACARLAARFTRAALGADSRIVDDDSHTSSGQRFAL